VTEPGVIEPGVTEPPKLLKNEIDEPPGVRGNEWEFSDEGTEAEEGDEK
jgi:hypothetical protein